MHCFCEGHGGSSCIERVPIFNNLSKAEMGEIAQVIVERPFLKGERIYAQGDFLPGLFVVNSGLVKIYRLSDLGKEQVLRVLKPGDFFGELALFTPSPLADFGEALDNSVLCLIAGARLKEIMGKYPSIAFKILEELSQRLEQTEKLLEDVSLHSAERRLAQTLLALAEGNPLVDLKMSKGDWASQLGMTQATLSRKLSAWQELGVIGLSGQRRIIIKDRAALEGILGNA